MEATSDFKYLQKLNFDPEQYKAFISKLINNFRSVFLLILLVIAIGLTSFFSLPRELNPEINIPIASITVSLAGASPRDIEQLIVDPIEKAVSPIEEVDYIESSSLQSFASIIIYLRDNTDTDKAIADISTAVEALDLPEDASDPTVQTIDFNEIPVLQTSIVSELDLLSVSKAAKEIETELEKSRLIRRVDLNGHLEERIYITLNLENIQKFDINPAQIINAIQSNDINLPSGSYEVNSIEYLITVDNSIKTIEDLREIIISVNGQSIPLIEIADVSYKPDPDFKNTINYIEKGGQLEHSVEFRIYKSNSAKIGDAVDEAERIIDEYLTGQNDIQRVDISNEAENIQKQFGDLTNNFIGTIFLVFGVLFLFLGIKQASVASLSIPLTFLTTFIIMNATGLTLNFLSLFSLLLSLGLVVDNAIVIVSGYNMYRSKFNPVEAALMVYKDFKIPIITTTLTTVWAFLPLLLSSGIIGAYIRSIPIVVNTALISSAIIAILINLPLMATLNSTVPPHVKKAARFTFYILLIVILYAILFIIFNQSPSVSNSYSAYLSVLSLIFAAISVYLLKDVNFKKWMPLNKSKNSGNRLDLLNKGLLNFSTVTNSYESLIRKILFSRTKRIIVIAVTALLILISIIFIATGRIKNEFFPSSDSEIIYVNLSGPSGWTNEKLQPHIEKTVDIITQLNELKFMTIIEGSNITADQSQNTGGNYAYIIVNLVEKEQRKISSMDITEELRSQIEQEVDINTSVIQFSGGPPAGADIQINILGDDFVVLEQINNQFLEILQSTPEIANSETSLTQASGQISIELLDAELAKRQLSAQEVSFWLRSIISETEVGEITNGANTETDMYVNINKEYNIDEIENLLIASSTGSLYSLSEVAEIRLETNPDRINRRDSKRQISVLGFVKAGESPTEVYNNTIKPKLEALDIPEGYEWNIGGVNEQNQESINSIVSQMILSFGLILATMVLQMNSFRKAVLVLSIIPIAIAGVIFNFSIFGIPLSFPSLIGILALFGIVVNNTIMLIEKISQNHKIGLEYLEGIIDACSSRLEPIFFTTTTTIAGLLPITLSDPLWQGLGGAIIAGLSLSGIIILFFLPVVYSWVFRKS